MAHHVRGKTKSTLINVVLVIASLCAVPFIVEGLLRIAASAHAAALTPPVAAVLRGRPEARYKLDANGSPIFVGGFKTYLRDGIPPHPVQYDDAGLRPRDVVRFRKAGAKIGVFGDSYIEGLQVALRDTIPAQTQACLAKLEPGRSYSVFNFGVGGTGTYQEYLRYKTIRKRVHLDIVVVAFLPLNDALNNDRELNRDFELPGSRYLAVTRDGFAEVPSLRGSAVPRLGGIKAWLAAHSYAATEAYQLWSNLECKYLYEPGGPRASWIQVYGPPPSQAWKDAWKITEESILRMRGAVEGDGAVFVLMLLTDAVQIAAPKELVGAAQFDYPNRRLRQFAAKNGIHCLDTYASFMAAKRTLAPPYFSWRNDGHYSPVGTHLAGRLLAEYIHKLHAATPRH